MVSTVHTFATPSRFALYQVDQDWRLSQCAENTWVGLVAPHGYETFGCGLERHSRPMSTVTLLIWPSAFVTNAVRRGWLCDILMRPV